MSYSVFTAPPKRSHMLKNRICVHICWLYLCSVSLGTRPLLAGTGFTWVSCEDPPVSGMTPQQSAKPVCAVGLVSGWALVIVSPPSKLCLSSSSVSVLHRNAIILQTTWTRCVRWDVGVHQISISTKLLQKKTRTECCPLRTQDSLSNPRNPWKKSYREHRRNIWSILSKLMLHLHEIYEDDVEAESVFFQFGKHHDKTVSTLETCTHYRWSIKMCSSFSISFEEVAIRCATVEIQQVALCPVCSCRRTLALCNRERERSP